MSDPSENNKNDFDIELIRQHGSGWREEWDRLVTDLVGDICRGKSGSLMKMCRKVCVNSGIVDSDIVRDFCCYVLERYQERVCCQNNSQDDSNGNSKSKLQPLFANYDAQQYNDPIPYLCSYTKLKLDLREFLRKEGKRRNCSLDDLKEPSKWEQMDCSEPEDRQVEAERVLNKLKSGFISKTYGLRGHQGETAGLELYIDLLARVDQSEAAALIELARQAVVIDKNAREETPDHLLRLEHQKADERYVTDRQNLQIKVKQCREGSQTSLTYENKLQKLLWNHWFCPVDASAMAGLFGLNKQSASQRIHRYNSKVRRYCDSLKCSDNLNEQ